MEAAIRAGRSLARPWLALGTYISRCYAAVLFCDSPAVGAMVLAITLSVPNVGIAGLLAALTAHLFARRFGYSTQDQEPYVYNSLLVGLSLGFLYHINGQLILLIGLGAVLTVLITQLLSSALWRLGRLPVLSLPFVLITWTLWLAAKSMAGLEPFTPVWPVDSFAHPMLNGLFTALGLFFFIPHPVAGIFLFMGIAWTSRYLALLAIAGYVTGYLVMQFIVGHPQNAPHIGFNFMLAAMAVGGFFTVPGRTSFLLALFAAALSAVLAVAIQQISMSYQLPVLTMPFFLATTIILAGLERRHVIAEPYLLLDKPGLPEASYERVRLAAARMGETGSIPLLAPFLGEWQVYQGFDGAHTHKPPWQHALDFFIVEGQRSFRSDGAQLEDYHCFGAMIVAPAGGQITACRDDLIDNLPGEVDTVRNWGNYIQIKTASGYSVVLAHLKQHSLLVKQGDGVTAGQCLASCGNSGRSPQPHIHMHIQHGEALGSPTIPFHLHSVIMRSGEREPQTFQLISRPAELASVAPALRDEKIATPLHLPVGRRLYFSFRNCTDEQWTQRCLRVELTLLGQFRLISDSGASAAFEESSDILAFYDRQGGNDVFLDMWLLAMGLTPLSSAAPQWHDQASARLLPLHNWQRLLAQLRPLGAALTSHYQRHWEPQSHQWRQTGQHTLCLLPRLPVHATTSATLSPVSGCSTMVMHAAGQQWEAVFEASGLTADNGVPSRVDRQTLPPQADVAAKIQGAEI